MMLKTINNILITMVTIFYGKMYIILFLKGPYKMGKVVLFILEQNIFIIGMEYN